MAELKIAIANGPQCPFCGCDGFDDWWHTDTIRSGHSFIVELYADLTCHDCGEEFQITRYWGGETHSTSTISPHVLQPEDKT